LANHFTNIAFEYPNIFSGGFSAANSAVGPAEGSVRTVATCNK